MAISRPESAKWRYELAYRYVRLRGYEAATYEDWDYAHNPTDEEIYYADLRWEVVEDCRWQLEEIKPAVEGTPELEAAYAHHTSRRDRVPRPKLAHLANCMGIAPFSHMPWRFDERDWYIGHFCWNLYSPGMSAEWNQQRRQRLLDQARQVVKS